MGAQAAQQSVLALSGGIATLARDIAPRGLENGAAELDAPRD
jgi:hypothetical protein